MVVVLSSCEGNIMDTRRKNKNRIEITLDLQNSYGNSSSHYFNAGEEKIIYCHFFFFVIFLVLLMSEWRTFKYEYDREGDDDTNYPFMVIYISLIIKNFSLVLELIDLMIMFKYGSSIQFLNFMAQAINYISQYFLTIIYIFLAHGWTTEFTSIDEFELSMPILILIGILKVIIIGLGKVTQNDVEVYHKYDGVVFYLLIAFHLGLFILFIVGIIDRFKQKKKKAFEEFFKEIAISGSFYFLLLPFILVFTKFLYPSNQMLFVEIGLMTAHVASVGFFFYITLRKKGSYVQIIKGSFDLPGAKFD